MSQSSSFISIVVRRVRTVRARAVLRITLKLVQYVLFILLFLLLFAEPAY